MHSFSKVLPVNGHTIYNISKEELFQIEETMRPGKSSGSGFLAANESLVEVCVRDLTTLLQLGISCEEISLTLLGLVKTARKSGEIIANRFKVTGFNIGTVGYQVCPFDDHHKGRFDFTVTNLRTNETLSFSDLAIDLIGKHAFFEGNIPYRVDPEKVCRVLELKPGEFKRVTEKSWTWARGGDNEEEAIAAAKKYAEKEIKLDEHATAYIGVPYLDYEKYENRNKPKAPRKPGMFDDCIVGGFKETPYIDDGKKYCHLFNRQDREEKVSFTIEGVKVALDIDYEGCFILELKEETYCTTWET